MWMTKTSLANSPKNNYGFTLVELLVVIAIIGLLIAILLPVLGAARDSGKKKICAADIQQLESALRIYEGDYYDFPPSTLKALGIQEDNGINSGIESIVACLSTVGKTTPYFEFADDKLENFDNDIAAVPLQKITGSYFNTNVLWEMIDPWGNPYIYFHNRDLTPETKHFYTLRETKQQVTPKMQRTKTGNIIGYTRYQIFSCATDEKLHTEDDITSK